MGASDKLSTPLDCLLCLFVFILCHNRLMRIFADIPFFFGNAPLVFVTDESAFADMVDHCSSVLHALYHSQNTAMCPLGLLGRRLSGHGFMLGGCWNALRIQFLIGFCNDKCRNHKGQHIRNRHGIEHAVQTEEHRQQQREAHAEHDMDSSVEVSALPMACRKIKHALLMHAKTIMQR